MRKYLPVFCVRLLFIFISVWGTGTVYAQDFPSEALQQKENERIVQTSNFFTPIDYCLADGTELSRKELLDLLATVPENDSLLQKSAALWATVCLALPLLRWEHLLFMLVLTRFPLARLFSLQQFIQHIFWQ